MERNDNICRQANTQSSKQSLNSKTEAHSNPLWIVRERANDVAMVENYKLNEDGIRDRFDMDKDVLGAKFIHQEKEENSVFFMDNVVYTVEVPKAEQNTPKVKKA